MAHVVWRFTALGLVAMMAFYSTLASILLTALFATGELAYIIKNRSSTKLSRALHRHLKSHTSMTKRLIKYFGFGASPLYIVSGGKSSGKSQLLSFAKPIASLKPLAPITLYKAHHTFYLVSEQTLGSKDEETSQLMNALVSIKQFYPLQGLILTLDVATLHNKATLTAHQKTLAKITDYHTTWPWLTYQICITKSDKICGFSEAFAQAPTAIKQAPLGVLLPHSTIDHDYTQVINQQMDYLTNQIAHSFKDSASLVHAIQALKPSLVSFSNAMQTCPIKLQGIFFTSTRFSPPLFVEDWLNKKHQPAQYYFHQLPLFRLCWLHGVFLTSCLLMTPLMTQQAHMARISKQMLTPWSQNPTEQLYQLQHVIQTYANYPQHKLFAISRDLLDRTSAIYHQILTHAFKNELKQHLESALSNHTTETIKDFAAYLDFCASDIKHPDKIKTWFKEHTPAGLSTPQHYESLVDELMSLQFTCETDKKIVSQASQYIEKIPNPKLIVLLAKNTLSKAHPDQTPDTLFYAIEHLDTILTEELPSQFNEIKQYQAIKASDLTEAKQIYLELYREHWQKKMAQLAPEHLDSFQAIQEELQAWQDIKSKKTQALAEIFTHIDKSKSPELFQQYVTKKLLHSSVDQDQTLTNLTTWAKDLNDYMTKMIQSDSVLEATKLRFQQYPQDPLSKIHVQLKTLPTPIQDHLLKIKRAIWKQMVHASKQALVAEWEKEIMPFYLQNIKAHYPIDHDAHEEIPFDQFHSFYGAKGKLQTFIDQQLSVFMQKHDNHWQWKSIQDQTLSQDSHFIELCNTLDMLHSLLFNDPSKTQNQWVFHIEEKASEEAINLTIKQDDQVFSPQTSQSTLTVNIPSKIKDLDIKIESPNETISQHFKGNWAWLRALEAAKVSKLTSKDNQRSLSIVFDQKDYRHVITASTARINVLTSGLFKKIALSQSLFSKHPVEATAPHRDNKKT